MMINGEHLGTGAKTVLSCRQMKTLGTTIVRNELLIIIQTESRAGWMLDICKIMNSRDSLPWSLPALSGTCPGMDGEQYLFLRRTEKENVSNELAQLSILSNSNLLYLASTRSELKRVIWVDGYYIKLCGFSITREIFEDKTIYLK